MAFVVKNFDIETPDTMDPTIGITYVKQRKLLEVRKKSLIQQQQKGLEALLSLMLPFSILWPRVLGREKCMKSASRRYV